MSFEQNTGILHVESGILLQDILDIFIPMGWTLPVCPGTKLISVGGAVANDVHGKSHHKDGSFGDHVESFGLEIPNGETLNCSRTQNTDVFWANIGGSGLLGHISTVKVILQKTAGPYFQTASYAAKSMDDLMDLLDTKAMEYPYSVGWIHMGRKRITGILSCGSPAPVNEQVKTPKKQTEPKISVPDIVPNNILNKLTIRAINAQIARKLSSTTGTVHFEEFFFPLDGIKNWNRAYGSNGFFQFQCVVPLQDGSNSIKKLLQIITESGCLPFMNVIKRMGKGNKGYMSFSMEGYTLALDFPTSKKTIALCRKLNEEVVGLNGKVYLAKDALLSHQQLRLMYPNIEQWLDIKRRIDPQNQVQSAQSSRLKLF